MLVITPSSGCQGRDVLVIAPCGECQGEDVLIITPSSECQGRDVSSRHLVNVRVEMC